MDAKRAAKVSGEIRRREEEERREVEDRRRKQVEEDVKIIAKSLITQLERDIPKEARKGGTSVSDEGPHTNRGGGAYGWACSIACEHFRKKGFTADHHDGEVEMGDNEYPHTSYYHRIVISWEKSNERY